LACQKKEEWDEPALNAGGKRRQTTGVRSTPSRYEQGDPSNGYPNQEVLDRYGSVAHKVRQLITSKQREKPLAVYRQSSRASLLVIYTTAQMKGIDVTARPAGGAGDVGWLLAVTAM
jgi:hypothetical protein